MSETSVQASVFKATCLELLDEVEETHTTIVVTKRGKPVAKLVPIDESTPAAGSLTWWAGGDEVYFSTDADWDIYR